MPEKLNKVSDADLLDAVEYLYTQGFIEEMTTDKRYYVGILLKHAGNDLGFILEDLE